MVYVLLARAWTDDQGVQHPNGDTVQVEQARLAELERDGFVKDWWGDGQPKRADGWWGDGDRPGGQQ